MNHFFWLYLFLMLGGLTRVSAQVDSLNKRLGFKLGYYGEFVLHPGMFVGLEYELVDKNWWTVHWDTDIGSYYHKWNNNGGFVQSSLGVRLLTPISIYTDINIGFGGMLTRPNGDIYSVNENNQLEEGGRPSMVHFKPTMNMLFGWDGTHKRNVPFLFFIGPELYFQSGFNGTFLPHGALRIGSTYKLSSKK